MDVEKSQRWGGVLLTESLPSSLLDGVCAADGVGLLLGRGGRGSAGGRVHGQRGVRGPPVGLQVHVQSLARVVQLVLVQDDVKHILQTTTMDPVK